MASGKTTLAKYLEDNAGFKRIVTYTTREPREGEKDGTDYHFITKERFIQMRDEGMFAETTEYTEYMYGSATDDYLNNSEDKKVIVLNPHGVRAVIDQIAHRKKVWQLVNMPYVVWLDTPQDVCMTRALNRSDDIPTIIERVKADSKDFISIRFGGYFNMRVSTPMDVEKLAVKVLNGYRNDNSMKNPEVI